MSSSRGVRPLPEVPPLVGQKLDGFTVQDFFEVSKLDEEGRNKVSVVGYFRDEDIANGFAGNQVGATWVEKVLLATDGRRAFLVGPPAKLLDNEKAALEMRQKALAKLSPGERKVLGL